MRSIPIAEDTLMRLERWASGEKAPPLKMTIYPTNRCNLNCHFCPGTYRRTSEKELTKAQWLNIISEALKMGVREWWITGGGEPMIRAKVTLDMVKMIKRHPDTFCAMITNGTLFTPQRVEELVRAGIDRIYFSIDAPDARIHDKLRARGVFDQVVNAIKLFKAYKRRLNKKAPKIGIGAILTRQNYKKLSQFVQLAHDLGCDKIKFQSLLIFKENRSSTENLIIKNTQRLEENIRQANDLSKKLGIELQIDEIGIKVPKKTVGHSLKKSGHPFLSSFCFEPWYAMFIDHQGNVGPCCSWDYGEMWINILTKSLSNIWYGNYFNHIRERIMANDLFDECESCGFRGPTNSLRKRLTKTICGRVPKPQAVELRFTKMELEDFRKMMRELPKELIQLTRELRKMRDRERELLELVVDQKRKLKENMRSIEEYQREIVVLNRRLKELSKNWWAERKRIIAKYAKQLLTKEEVIRKLRRARERQTRELRASLKKLERAFGQEKKRLIVRHAKQLMAREAELRELEEQRSKLTRDYEAKLRELEERHQAQMAKHERERRKLERLKRREIKEIHEERRRTIERIKKEEEGLRNELISNFTRQLKSKDDKIRELMEMHKRFAQKIKSLEGELEEIHKSISYRIGKRASELLIPIKRRVGRRKIEVGRS